MHSLDWLRNSTDKVKQSRGETSASVRCDEIGLTLIVTKGEPDQQTQSLAWGDVKDVFAFKRDCFAVDQICLAIGSDDLEQAIEVAECDEGYENLIEQLPKRLIGFPALEQWLQRVALPPFETQGTRLYRRKA